VTSWMTTATSDLLSSRLLGRRGESGRLVHAAVADDPDERLRWPLEPGPGDHRLVRGSHGRARPDPLHDRRAVAVDAGQRRFLILWYYVDESAGSCTARA
jgi:hypothetical protein